MGSYDYYKKRFEQKVKEYNELHKYVKWNYRLVYIYFIRNIENNKVYIGRSIDYNERYKQHMASSFYEKSDVYNTPLHKDVRRYGVASFVIGLLDCELCKHQEYSKANSLEVFYMEKYNTLYPNGYNISGLSGKKLKDAKRRAV